MAKYAYAPLSVDENTRRKGKSPHDVASENERDDNLVNERMPMCVGICVLLAIVYVLSRTGGGNVVATTGPPPLPDDPNLRSATVPIPVVTSEIPTIDSTTTSTTSSSTASSSLVTKCPDPITCPQCPTKDNQCAGLIDPKDIDMGELRSKALANTPPHIIECSAANAGESQSACHLPSSTRYAALGQKGATLWMTGCSGAGKTTIATALEDRLVKHYGKHVYRLDGDNLRTGINRDLTFSEADRAEAVRRSGEIATLFADSGVITLVGLISPYRADRDAVRKRHEDQGIPFYEVFLDVPVDELKKRDPKGQYARVESGELKHFTCIDDPYEEPLYPEITLKTHELQIEESADQLFRMLEMDGILEGAPKLTPPGLPNPDGDVVVDLHVPSSQKSAKVAEAASLPKVRITDIDLNWLQVIGEGWASPLKGFMREGTLLETLHFNSLLVDPFNLTGNALKHESKTNFESFPNHQAPQRVSMSIPITLSCTDYTKNAIESSGQTDVALVTQLGEIVAILRDAEIYNNRKEEIVTRMYGVIDPGHPYIANIYSGGDYLIGGEVELLDRIKYNDGLDQWRKTANELMEEFQQKGADTVFAFQTRNPTHAGHAYLMKSAGDDLKKQGYKKPVLWLSPLGGWTKSDDVPLDVRVKQHEEVLKAGISHPGGLDPDSTVMAIWPAPMVYAGPTEVEFHAKSRRSAGASYFVVGRDPAGMKGSSLALAHPDDDLYDGDHGRYVLQNSPGIGNMKMLSFVKVMYDISDNVMKIPDETRMQDFISISGTKMRLLARNGAVPCSPTDIPTDLVEANCIPSGFMVPEGWKGVVDYYKNIEDSQRWIPWSRPIITPPADSRTTYTGNLGTTAFQLKHKEYISFWHDIPLRPSGEPDNIITLVVEIPMRMTAKMELNKKGENNHIAQDVNKDGSARYYTYGTPFFNYGFIPQTWEDPSVKSSQGYAGDNDPLDVIEIGSSRLLMGSITPCKVLGSVELIDEGETDHKIICINLNDPDAEKITSMSDLDQVKPGTITNLIHWLKNYKTSDGKPQNSLAQEEPTSAQEAIDIIAETHLRWRALCGHDGTTGVLEGSEGFWLDSPGCKGE
mmetsp:Transcript_18511/g.26054  ORF Transcript_18511/g.26054 Transcript_18511/m.26054 type:complete len:1092 (+) Transcript_18511:37-3312(+)|eukprot:CAMPEP_0184862952 /NCGR_PEP_ID=MMETSP0580-20130426/8166_1 /TAXON_ID=1118495 /ORGANISM="Dactyliosolen fragilissimus" /LENGTH=1091 /DNA_ID=CAMNT_0027360975 /DNA_START=22 /DNA_END=3297 /DNA_ORIENTATION=-